MICILETTEVVSLIIHKTDVGEFYIFVHLLSSNIASWLGQQQAVFAAFQRSDITLVVLSSTTVSIENVPWQHIVCITTQLLFRITILCVFQYSLLIQFILNRYNTLRLFRLDLNSLYRSRIFFKRSWASHISFSDIGTEWAGCSLL